MADIDPEYVCLLSHRTHFHNDKANIIMQNAEEAAGTE